MVPLILTSAQKFKEFGFRSLCESHLRTCKKKTFWLFFRLSHKWSTINHFVCNDSDFCNSTVSKKQWLFAQKKPKNEVTQFCFVFCLSNSFRLVHAIFPAVRKLRKVNLDYGITLSFI
jgi:hypothetical protein